MRKITRTSRAAAQRSKKNRRRKISGPGPTLTGGPNARKLTAVTDPAPAIGDAERTALLSQPVNTLMKFTVRAERGLSENGIVTVADLIGQTARQLYAVPGVAKATIDKIYAALHANGLQLKGTNAASAATPSRLAA